MKKLLFSKKITCILLTLLTFLTCVSVKTTKAEDGYVLHEDMAFYDLFDLTPLSSLHVGYLQAEQPGVGSRVDAFCIEPDVLTHDGDVYTGSFYSANDSVKQVLLNYYYYYRSNELFETTAGYYAAQLAVWGRLKGYDPAGLTITSQNELASKIRNLASALYNDSRNVSAGTNFTYNGSSPSESYTLTKGKNLSIYYYDGAWYYRSEKMVVTNYGTAGNLNFTVSLDGEGFITDSSMQMENKAKTMTFGSGTSRGNIFYVFMPVSTTAGETTVSINANYNYADVMTWDFSNGAYGFGQRMMGVYKASGSSNYSIKFIREAAEEEPEIETKYKAKINFTKTGLGVSDYSTSTVNNEILYSLTNGQTNIDTYLAFYTVEEDGSNKLMGEGAYRTSNGQLTASNLPLSYIDSNNKGRVLVCEIDSPDGYGYFKDDENPFEKNGHTYSCFKYVFNTANANGENIITRDITEEDSAKTFTVNVSKKDQNGTVLSGYNFGLYTTKEITVSGKTSIPAGSLVAYATTDNSGTLTFNSYLPASQNYVLKEIGSGDENTAITINGNTSYGTEATLDVLDKATVDGYTYNIEVVNKIVYEGSVKITKTDKVSGTKLAGAAFSISNGSNIYACTTGEDGTCTIENVERGTYTLTETKAPEGYVLNNETQTITVETNKQTTAEVKNLKASSASFTVTKKTDVSTKDKFQINVEDMNNSTGYTLTADSEDNVFASGDTKTYSLVFEKAGTYQFKVTEANCVIQSGSDSCTDVGGRWSMDTTSKTVKFVVDENLNVTSYVDEVQTNSPAVVISNTYTVGSLTIKKVDSKNATKVLEGAEFELFDSSSKTYGKQTTGKDGTVTWENLPYGTYYYQETKAPEGYVIDRTAKQVEVKQAKAQTTAANNTQPTGTFTITKVSTNNVDNGDTFEFSIVDSKATENAGAYTMNKTDAKLGIGDSNSYTLTFKKAGTYEFNISEKNCVYEEGSDVCKTVGNKWKMDSTTHTVKFDVVEENQNSLKVTTYLDGNKTDNANVVFNNTYNLGVITVKKTDTTANGKAVAGATMQLLDSKNQVVGTDTTDKEGKVTFTDLAAGTYYIKETNAPNGYQLSTDIKEVKVVGGKNTDVSFINYPKGSGSISVNKKVSGVESTKDTFEFDLEYVGNEALKDAYTVKSGASTTLKVGETNLHTYEFDKAGTYEFKVTEQACVHKDGDAICSESNRWEFDASEYIVKFEVAENGTTKTYVNNHLAEKAELEFNNSYISNSITINKTNAKTGTKLAGAKFELLNADNEKVAEGTTDATGTIVWNDLVYGTYTVKETEVPSGFIDRDYSEVVVLDKDNKNVALTVLNTPILEVNLTIDKTIAGIDKTTDKFEFTIKNITNEDDTNNAIVSKIGAGTITKALKFDKPGTYTYLIEETSSENWLVNAKAHSLSIVVDNDMDYKATLDGQTLEGGLKVSFKNTLKIDSTSITINKKFNLDDDLAKKFTSSFTIVDMATKKAYKSTTIKGNGKSTVSFDFDEVGTYKYQIYENKLNQEGVTYDTTIYDLTFEVSYKDGKVSVEANQTEFDFNNNYDAGKVDVYIPITKVLNGTNSTDYKFEFQNNGEIVATIKGQGTLNFYKRLGVGEYTYKITEKNTGIANITYDSTEYLVKVKVERDGLELKASVEYYVGDKKVDKIVFTNTYTEPKKDEATDDTPVTPTPSPAPVDSCTSKGSDYFWAADGTCQKRVPNTSSK